MLTMRLIFFVLGLAMLTLFAYVLGNKVLFWRAAQEATATVIAFEAHSDGRNGRPARSITQYPVLSFLTARNEAVQVVAPGGSKPNPYVLGQRVTLRYNPAQPHQIELPDFASRWLALLVSGLFGLAGVWLLRAAGRRG